MTAAPEELTDRALEEWERLADRVEITEENRGILAMLCQAWGDWQEARAFLREQGGQTYVVRDKDGAVVAVKPFPQVLIARQAQATYERLAASLRLIKKPKARSVS